MRIGNRVFWLGVLIAPLAGCGGGIPPSPTQASSPVARTSSPLPPWLAASSTQWAQRPWPKAEVGAVWRVRHDGHDALLIDAPGKRHDTLVDPDGFLICKPAGFGAPGDGRCPAVADAGTTPRLAWVHPGNPSPNFGPPPPESDPAVAARETLPPREPLPAWLEAKVAEWEHQDLRETDAYTVSRLQYRGATAYLVQAGCCDRYNTLYDAGGVELCSPSGGFAGGGDGKCPKPEDPGTRSVEVWKHPGLSEGR